MMIEQQILVSDVSAFRPRVFLKLLVLIAIVIGFATPGHAEDTAWKASGRVTVFADSAVAGDGDNSTQFSGRLDVFVSSGELWEGEKQRGHVLKVE